MNQRIAFQMNQKYPLSFASVRSNFLQRKCSCGNHSVAGGECSACAEKKPAFQRRSAEYSQATAVPTLAQEILASSGQPLDAPVRSFMEQQFGQDFSQVRVHTDARASDSARAVNAHAYTVGNHMVFGAGQYTPETRKGGHLLAHELTHVVQQGGSGAGGVQHAKAISNSFDASEIEAETLAARIMNGRGPVQVTQPASAVVHGLSIGEGIGIGVGVAAGATLLGLGIAALAGAFGGRRRWSIVQSNTNGANYSSAVNLTFNPDRDSMNCTEIAFVQSLIFSDATTGTSVETIPNYVNRRTSSGWTLDRIEARRYGWYSYNNDGRPGGNVSPGSSPSPLRAATMHDTPSDTRPNSVFHFETCAICKSGADANRVYSCYHWGFNVDGSNQLTSRANQETVAPSPEFSESIRQWNTQAAGPATTRNEPNQQPLGPFR